MARKVLAIVAVMFSAVLLSGQAAAQVITDDEFPLTPAQEKELHNLVDPAVTKHKYS